MGKPWAERGTSHQKRCQYSVGLARGLTSEIPALSYLVKYASEESPFLAAPESHDAPQKNITKNSLCGTRNCWR